MANLILLYSYACVHDRDSEHLPLLIERGNDSNAALPGEFESILNQVDQNLLQSHLISYHALRQRHILQILRFVPHTRC